MRGLSSPLFAAYGLFQGVEMDLYFVIRDIYSIFNNSLFAKCHFCIE